MALYGKVRHFLRLSADQGFMSLIKYVSRSLGCMLIGTRISVDGLDPGGIANMPANRQGDDNIPIGGCAPSAGGGENEND